MTWSYNLATLATTPKDQVRREMGDVVSTDQQVQDEEITLALGLEPSILSSAARCCEWLEAQYARKADISEGKLRVNASQRSKAYQIKARLLRSLDAYGAVPYIGGESITDKDNTNQDADRVPPSFFRGMTDNQYAQQDQPDDTQTNIDDGSDPSEDP